MSCMTQAAPNSNHCCAIASARRRWSIGVQTVSLILFMSLSTWLGVLVGRGISRSLGVAVSTAENIAAGRYDNVIDVRGDNETGRVLRAVGRMQDELKQRTENESTAREKERAVAAESMRVKVGLDSVSGNVLLADKDNRIIYLNKAIQQMFRAAAADFRQPASEFRCRSPHRHVDGSARFRRRRFARRAPDAGQDRQPYIPGQHQPGGR